MPKVEFVCSICQEKHQTKISEVSDPKVVQIIYKCPNLDRRYKLTDFFVDTTRNLYLEQISKHNANEYTEKLKSVLGEDNFKEKFDRWFKIDMPNIGLIDEYPYIIAEIINNYSSGYCYPSVTAACCLTERILNRLILKTRRHFKGHRLYKKYYRKDSFNDWDTMLMIIKEWDLVPANAIEIIDELKDIRHQTIHYSKKYNFEEIVEDTINKLIEAITEIFGVLNRKDIYYVFDIPGEIWVRSEVENLPFVKEFVLPFCYHAHAVHDIDFDNKRVIERLGKTGKLTDEEFIELRKSSLYRQK